MEESHQLHFIQACLPILDVDQGQVARQSRAHPSHLTSPLIENNSEITEQFGIGQFLVQRERPQRVGNWDARVASWGTDWWVWQGEARGPYVS